MCLNKIIWSAVFTATAIVACVMIYEDLTLDRGVCGGGASLSWTLVTGNPAGPQYGILRQSYWTDPAGKVIIPYVDPHRLPPGSKHHIFAELLVDDMSFRLPLRPWADGALAVLVVGALGWFFAFRTRPRIQAHEPSGTS